MRFQAATLISVADASRARRVFEDLLGDLPGAAGVANPPTLFIGGEPLLPSDENVLALDVQLLLAAGRLPEARARTDELVKRYGSWAKSAGRTRLLAAVRTHLLAAKTAYCEDAIAAAGRSLDEVDRLLRESPDPVPVYEFESQFHRATFAARAGDHERAVSLFRAANGVVTTRYNRWTATVNLALTLLAGGKPAAVAEAKDLLEGTLADVEGFADTAFEFLTDGERQFYLTYHRWALGAYLSAARRTPVGAADLYQRVLAYKAASFWRSRGELLTQNGLRKAVPAAVGGLGAAEADHTWQDTCLLVQEIAGLRGGSPADVEARAKQIERRQDQLEERQRHLRSMGPRVAEASRLRDVKVADVLAALPHGTTLVDFVETEQLRVGPAGEVRTESRLHLFVLRPGQPVTAKAVAATSDDLGRAVGDWWRELDPSLGGGGSRGGVARLNALSRSVGTQAELLDVLPGRVPPGSRLVVSPDGPLWGFPVAALPSATPGHTYLAQDVPTRYVLSAHQLVARPRAAPQEGGPGRRHALVVREVTYPVPELQPIDMTPVLDLFTRCYRIAYADATVRTLTRDAATRSAVIEALSDGPQDVVLSGHLCDRPPPRPPATLAGKLFARGVPRPGVYIPLAGAGDGVPAELACTDFEVVPFGLTGSVGMIQCAGTSGVPQSGEAVYGFPREWLLRGARRVWTTMWPIKPEHCRDLLSSFIQRYVGDNQPIEDALADAQREMIARNDDARHPRYWAGWVLIGDGGALSPDNPPPVVPVPAGKELDRDAALNLSARTTSASSQSLWAGTAVLLLLAGLVWLFARYRGVRAGPWVR